MTEREIPWPKTEDELLAYIHEQMDGGHDYNTSAESALAVTVAAFNYAAHVMGLTGFQAGWIGMGVLAEINSIKGPFGIIMAENMLYPQYDEPSKVREWQGKWAQWLGDEARKHLAEREHAHPDVIAHWERLAAAAPAQAVAP